jgi:hypothetical protein
MDSLNINKKGLIKNKRKRIHDTKYYSPFPFKTSVKGGQYSAPHSGHLHCLGKMRG